MRKSSNKYEEILRKAWGETAYGMGVEKGLHTEGWWLTQKGASIF